MQTATVVIRWSRDSLLSQSVKLVSLARRLHARILLKTQGETIDLRHDSIITIVALVAVSGVAVIEVAGEGEQQVLGQVVQLFLGGG